MAIDNNVLKYLSYGMYVISSLKNNSFNGQIANSLMQISNSPVTIALSLNKKTQSARYLMNMRLVKW
ncbi:flavin reductase domain-containing FMN-binding protein [Candidatus Omnitrophus magneticus]|uniref:Flavin reductase domain-containing FMN-binding protein n=1 Tax=Candidatus Omnitrophus magneticus TaxID=1609969 RepID=A0A0F0CV64_9BACT|nr:flavin reductase domain-containing FMN-binding protein [Candidatus Omnitrophus magneticus]